MNLLDQNYIDKLLLRGLEKGTQKNANQYRFFCPYCQRGEKSNWKRSGYLYPKGNSYNFKCFREKNCGKTTNFSNFLEDQDPKLHERYVLDRYKEGTTGKGTNCPNPEFKFKKPIFK